MIPNVDEKYAEIYERAGPYLDTRHNDLHVRIAYGFALRLLEEYREADEAVVLPAVILHDTGWKTIPEDQHLKAFGPKMTDPDLRRVHEVEGARIANEILTAVGYDAARREEIVAIIDGHDSRETAMSLNDKVVKDADKLWRFSRTAMEIDHRRFGYELREYFGWLERQIDDWFFTPEATRMARESFTEARAALIG
ncbi:MAG: hypothetical protein A3H36_05015 [Chloroflexi bacterium RIFCSPLOWO2_02_FULL_71_16]|nr:MAG: hypothetical protein A3H36_05015 [Chloroflexi bacterium RIFCSPLOWO2_02_FULL_71_16]